MGFEMCLYYFEDIKCKTSEYFCHRGGDCLDVFVEKMNKNLYNFENFSRQK